LVRGLTDVFLKERSEQIINSKKAKELVDLFWGIRMIPGKYSKSMSDWFYDQLQKSGDVNPLKAIHIVNQAVEIESDKVFRTIERLISLESLKSAFEMEIEE
jgi:hypothetical protein